LPLDLVEFADRHIALMQKGVALGGENSRIRRRP
jgi:hypothetical protein